MELADGMRSLMTSSLISSLVLDVWALNSLEARRITHPTLSHSTSRGQIESVERLFTIVVARNVVT